MKREGPYVLLALFCEDSGVDEQARLWVQGVFGISVIAPLAPGSQELQGTVKFSARIVGGGFDGKHELTLRCDTLRAGVAWDVHFSGEADEMPVDALNLAIRLRVLAEGTHWFDLAIDGEVLTRIPLRLVRQDTLLGL